ncbi:MULTISPECIES: NUDIX domain-containing protein [Streptomyces]|uniref:NUDIX domain-containing protein n=1 Tax=Streptomyces TaxID=1883 RepID=UPI001E4AE954|nr:MULTISPECIES: NUDIX domain-containing protein [Streptomyces]WGP14398.1 NUDIX domain-containing protein [Streptomyces sp. SH5]
MLPGGTVEKTDVTPEATLHREAAEEARLPLTEVRPFARMLAPPCPGSRPAGMGPARRAAGPARRGDGARALGPSRRSCRRHRGDPHGGGAAQLIKHPPRLIPLHAPLR